MEIGSVNSAASAAVQASRQAQAPVVEQEQKPPEQPKQVESERQEPRPVKNAEGQTTGTVINTTA